LMVPVARWGLAKSPIRVPVTAGPEVVPTTVSSGASVLNVAREYWRTVKVICWAMAGMGAMANTSTASKERACVSPPGTWVGWWGW
jgi:hypothetical protein